MTTVEALLDQSTTLHHHLCPRQVLGVRMGVLAGRLLNLTLPQQDKRLLTIAETDGCAVDGISVATGCWVGRRTLRIEDYGKVAATFVDTLTDQAIRIAPRPEVRQLAPQFAPEADSRWQAYLLGYQRMPDELLFSWQAVILKLSADILLSQPGLRTTCQICGEEIMNEREVIHEESTLCRACAGFGYYTRQ